MTVGPYELNWVTEQYKCWLSQWISTALLASLQALNLFWLYHILRIAYRIVFFNVIEDDRSDNDENEEEQIIDALAGQGVDQQAGMKILANRIPNGNGTSTGLQTNPMTNRKENKREP